MGSRVQATLARRLQVFAGLGVYRRISGHRRGRVHVVHLLRFGWCTGIDCVLCATGAGLHTCDSCLHHTELVLHKALQAQYLMLAKNRSSAAAQASAFSGTFASSQLLLKHRLALGECTGQIITSARVSATFMVLSAISSASQRNAGARHVLLEFRSTEGVQTRLRNCMAARRTQAGITAKQMAADIA
jgi:hypothetical protein